MGRPILTLKNPRPKPPEPPDPLGDTPVPLVVTVEIARRLGILPARSGSADSSRESPAPKKTGT